MFCLSAMHFLDLLKIWRWWWWWWTGGGANISEQLLLAQFTKPPTCCCTAVFLYTVTQSAVCSCCHTTC